ncbi:aspartate 1-decarboxylase [Proteinivorax tanatarense]|uniref:Aspartate 1-decarboxylase n=1 Tax=Proteinivorax tanatarense TaxID=1260629 RepID=A0AAU7VIM7_9FIRM
MLLTMFKSKIHKATVTEADLNYVGSVTIDSELLKASNILPHEKVQVVNNNNGARLETYVIKGEPGSKTICLNGAAARLVQPGDNVIIISYCQVDEKEAKEHEPTIVFVDDDNNIQSVENGEKHGEKR